MKKIQCNVCKDDEDTQKAVISMEITGEDGNIFVSTEIEESLCKECLKDALKSIFRSTQSDLQDKKRQIKHFFIDKEFVGESFVEDGPDIIKLSS